MGSWSKVRRTDSTVSSPNAYLLPTAHGFDSSDAPFGGKKTLSAVHVSWHVVDGQITRRAAESAWRSAPSDPRTRQTIHGIAARPNQVRPATWRGRTRPRPARLARQRRPLQDLGIGASRYYGGGSWPPPSRRPRIRHRYRLSCSVGSTVYCSADGTPDASRVRPSAKSVLLRILISNGAASRPRCRTPAASHHRQPLGGRNWQPSRGGCRSRLRGSTGGGRYPIPTYSD